MNRKQGQIAVVALGLLCAVGIAEGGAAQRREMERTQRHRPPVEAVEVWCAPKALQGDGVSAERAAGAPAVPPSAPATAAPRGDAPAPDAPPYLGEFYITVYTPECDGGVWGYQTATGETSRHLATCAVDPDVIPLGTVLDVGGLQLTAVDTGSAVKDNVIDVFYDGTREEALCWLSAFGTTAPVWLQAASVPDTEEVDNP